MKKSKVMVILECDRMELDEIKIESLNSGYVVTTQRNNWHSMVVYTGPRRKAFSTLDEMLVYVLPLLGVVRYDGEAEDGETT